MNKQSQNKLEKQDHEAYSTVVKNKMKTLSHPSAMTVKVPFTKALKYVAVKLSCRQ